MFSDLHLDKENLTFNFIDKDIALWNSLRRTLLSNTHLVYGLILEECIGFQIEEASHLFKYMYINNLYEVSSTLRFSIEYECVDDYKIITSDMIQFSEEIPNDFIRKDLYICIVERGDSILLKGHVDIVNHKLVSHIGPGNYSETADGIVLRGGNVSFLELLSPLVAMKTATKQILDRFISFKENFNENSNVSNSGKKYTFENYDETILNLLIKETIDDQEVIFISFVKEHSLLNKFNLMVLLIEGTNYDEFIIAGIDRCINRIRALGRDIEQQFTSLNTIIQDY